MQRRTIKGNIKTAYICSNKITWKRKNTETSHCNKVLIKNNSVCYNKRQVSILQCLALRAGNAVSKILKVKSKTFTFEVYHTSHYP